MTKLHFEDFQVGEVAEYGPRLITRAEIMAFSKEFDPQPMHLDDAGGSESMLGGFAGSGWQMCCIIMRMMSDWFLLDSSSQGSPGVEEMKWLKPLRPDENLTLRRTVMEKRVSSSNPSRGFVRMQFDLLDSTGAAIASMVAPMMFGLRKPSSG